MTIRELFFLRSLLSCLLLAFSALASSAETANNNSCEVADKSAMKIYMELQYTSSDSEFKSLSRSLLELGDSHSSCSTVMKLVAELRNVIKGFETRKPTAVASGNAPVPLDGGQVCPPDKRCVQVHVKSRNGLGISKELEKANNMSNY